jgi:hypothetical protein
MVFTVGMTNTMTHPEDRPMTFELPEGRNWLQPGDRDYMWVMDDLREHDAIAFVLGQVVPRSMQQSVLSMLPQIHYGRRGRIELTWCNIKVVFKPTWFGCSYRIASCDCSWVSIRPDYKMMVTV